MLSYRVGGSILIPLILLFSPKLMNSLAPLSTHELILLIHSEQFGEAGFFRVGTFSFAAKRNWFPPGPPFLKKTHLGRSGFKGSLDNDGLG